MMKLALVLIFAVVFYLFTYLAGTFNLPQVCKNRYVFQNKQVCQAVGCVWGDGLAGRPLFCGAYK
jgi:hypothetical protein